MKKFRLATWNINECIENTTCNLSDQKISEEINNNTINRVVDIINSNNIDIICFQEFPIKIDNKKELIDSIISKTELKYYIYKETSQSYLFKGGRVGVAIFSKYKIENYYTTLFNNPKLVKIANNGDRYESFDKGIILIKVNIQNEIYNIITGHAIAFAPFDKNEFDYPESYKPLVDLINKFYTEKLIVAGDFNSSRLFDLIPEIYGKVQDVVKVSTTYNFYENKGAVQMDYILLSNNLQYSNFHKIDNFSDHFICCIDINE